MNKPTKTSVSFSNGRGEQLAGIIDQPAGGIKAWALFAHCFTCSKEIVTARRICNALAENGIAVLRFDFTGLEDSEGDFSATTFTTNVADVMAATEFLSENCSTPELFVGHSLGGAAILAAAGEIPSAKALVTINTPSDPSHLNPVFEPYLNEIHENGSANVPIVGRDFLIKKAFIDDLQTHQLETKISRIKKPILILHSPGDEIVSITEASKIFQAAKHPKCFISLDATDHLITTAGDAVYTADLIASWASRYLVNISEARADAVPQLDQDELLVRETGENYRNEVIVRNHRFIVDEPVPLGGQDLGPKPSELLLAALGSCTTITLRMYVEHKGWEVGRISARLKKEKASKDQPTKIELILEVEGQLDDNQIKRMKAIANRCPVYLLLMSDMEISHELNLVHSA